MSQDDQTAAGRKPYGPRFLVALLLVLWAGLHGFSTAGWMERNGYDARPLFGDAAAYRVPALELRRAMVRGGPAEFFAVAGGLRSHHAPGIAAAAALASPDDDILPRDAVRVQSVFLLLFAAGAYRLARRFAGRGPALLGALVATTAPVVALSLRPLYPQFPMAACLVWATDALLRSQGFTRLKWAVAFGLWTGAALWFKNLVPLYVIGGGVAALVVGLRSTATRRTVVRGAFASVAAAFLLAGPYYLRNLDLVLARVGAVAGETGQSDWSGGLSVLDPRRLLYYPRAMFVDGFGPALAAMVLIGTVILIVQARRAHRKAPDAVQTSEVSGRDGVARFASFDGRILGAELIVTAALLTFGQTAGGSFYLTGAAAFGGVVIAAACGGLRGRSRVVFAALAVVVALWNLIWIGRPSDAAAPRVKIGSFALDASPDVMFGALLKDYRLKAEPAAEPWPARSFAERIATPSRGRQPVLLFGDAPSIGPHPLCCHVTLAYETARLGAQAYCGMISEISDPAVLRTRMLDADYVFIEERWMKVEAAATFAEALGLRLESVARARPTAEDAFALMAARPSFAPPRRAAADDLSHADVVPVDIAFDGGLRLVGFRLARAAGETVVALFFAAGPDGAVARGDLPPPPRVDVEVRREPAGRVAFDGVDFAPVEGVPTSVYRSAFFRGFPADDAALLVRIRSADGTLLRPSTGGRSTAGFVLLGDGFRLTPRFG